MTPIRWSNADKYFGPFTHAHNKDRGQISIVLGSGDLDDNPGCRFRVTLAGHTLIARLPQFFQPWKQRVIAKSWDAVTVAHLGRNWYLNSYERDFGLSYSEGFLQVFFGTQTMDSSSTKSWSMLLPWTQWRHTRFSLYGINGEHFWTQCKGASWETQQNAEDSCPLRTFAFSDFDGEKLTVTTRIEEREWLRGDDLFKWLSLFSQPRIRRSLDLMFSGGTGNGKSSWKGGTIGHSIDMLPGELHEAAFKRYCDQHQMTFGRDVLSPHTTGDAK